MKRTVTVFDLGRMRHLDLLALWHRLNPDLHEQYGKQAAQMTTGQIVASILEARTPKT